MTEIEILLTLRNHLFVGENEGKGELLIKYLSDLLTENCCKNREPLELKGFGECIQRIKDIPKEVEYKNKLS